MRIRSLRPGFTLIEMTMVLFALSAAMVLGGALLVATLKAHRLSTRMLATVSRRAQLADRFRADAAGAVAATVAPDSSRVELRLPGDEEITYRWDGTRLERGHTVRGKTSWHNVHVGDCQAVEFHGEGDKLRLVTLRIVENLSPSHVDRVDRPTLEIRAAVGGGLR